MIAQQTDNGRRNTIKPGKQIILTKAQTFRRSEINEEMYTAWKLPELVLDNTPPF